MADTVTYTDLKFVKFPVKEAPSADEDLTYENVSGLKPTQEESSVGPSRARGQCQPGAGKIPALPLLRDSAAGFFCFSFYRSQRIVRCSVDLPDIKTRSDPQRTNRQQETRRPWALAIPLVLCLVFFISAIAVTVKFVQLSREYSEQNSSLSETIQNLLEEKALSRGESQKQLQALEEGLGSANRSLRQCHRAQEESAENVRGLRERLDEAQRDAAETQRELGDTRSQLQALREGLCPTDWIFYNMKCYFISKEKYSWYSSKSHCESLQSALVTVRQDDTNLQAFLAARLVTFWVGKEIYWNENSYSTNVEWRWPAENRIYKNQCGVFRDGQLAADECRESRPYICERSLVLLGLKPQDKNPQYKMSVNDVKFNCYQCAWCRATRRAGEYEED
ncbi:B-cell differentiation antigen CD72-like [Spea bombifrons]|uniref:B-cell differentiation antigen CD72-like n=1 Tax=Spea bombifrons TaxID=233779 RepID=UPI002349BFF2|nr:B-cell differentiation antigen CD72-like [Spea bombifrons]